MSYGESSIVTGSVQQQLLAVAGCIKVLESECGLKETRSLDDETYVMTTTYNWCSTPDILDSGIWLRSTYVGPVRAEPTIVQASFELLDEEISLEVDAKHDPGFYEFPDIRHILSIVKGYLGHPHQVCLATYTPMRSAKLLNPPLTIRDKRAVGLPSQFPSPM